MKKFNKTNVTAILVEIQDRGDVGANAIATQAIKDFGLRNIHQKITGNSDSAYKLHRVLKPKVV
jgi:hypothetical protein